MPVKDFNFSQGTLTVHDGKGAKDRVTILSPSLRHAIEVEIHNALQLQVSDDQHGIGLSIPEVLAKKYPSAYRQSAWIFLFPSSGLCNHPITGTLCRYHLHDSVPRKSLRKAVAGTFTPLDAIYSN